MLTIYKLVKIIMSDLISIYENNCTSLITKIKTFLDNISNVSPNDSIAQEQFDSTFNLISEAEKTLKQMRIELSSIQDKTISTTYNQKFNEFTNTISSLKKQLRQEQEKANSNHANYTLGLDSNKQNNGNWIGNEEVAFRSSNKLEEARRVLAGTEDASNKIMSNMDEQTNQMKGVSVKIKGMNDTLDNSNSWMSKMQVRYNQNKNLIKMVALILLGILLLVIAFKIIF